MDEKTTIEKMSDAERIAALEAQVAVLTQKVSQLMGHALMEREEIFNRRRFD
jgi:ribosomal protein S15P/S13E